MKTLFFFLVLATSLSLNAQITKGNWLVGGDASFNSSTVNDSDGNEVGKSSGIRIFPNIGHFFFDKFAVGLTPSFFYSKTKNGPSSVGYGIGPFARYYFLKPENRINLFADANFIYFSSKTKGFSSTSNSSYRIKAGPVLYFNSSVALEFTIGYNSANFSTTTNTVELGFGFQIHLEK
ncbi:outer membrane beta-barrel protein [Subsaximicrobium wynnwilliamsii]|uniref:Outer membrane beta-barrel protein n=1 Tax=Subsaximicrobium wynnwilliamsii TaxID=291179 RepID=A0A5C6ZAP0_9FLAO|nr:outer membrane beta-barrel protein [Subsaximicrobium wynnwilliamsii]TXD80647.1 outer membrane beta-barrel protein [Subsaximicrobium wynnwilliamsii]TXD86380.1 outer membrane beta-barrel protein [Subsaximicrobium wynnwilliamsii]TXD99810.1 outer membrane beta-barrel protein [Subsaximicrobium wynnwilliamsii]